MAKQAITFAVDDEDHGKACWPNGSPKRKRDDTHSEAIHQTLRDGVPSRGEATVGDVYQTVKELMRKMQVRAACVVDVPDGLPDDIEADPELAEALSALDELGL